MKQPVDGVEVVTVLGCTALLWWPFWAWQGYLGAIMWRWFAVGLFGVHPLTTWQAAATIMLLKFFLPDAAPSDSDNDAASMMGRAVMYGFLYPLIMFASGAIVRFWIL